MRARPHTGRVADPVQTIADTVRVRARRGELADGPEAAIREELRRYAERAFASTAPLIADERQAERRIAAELTGFGPLQPLLDDRTVEEIWINVRNGPGSALLRGCRPRVRHRFVSRRQNGRHEGLRR